MIPHLSEFQNQGCQFNPCAMDPGCYGTYPLPLHSRLKRAIKIDDCWCLIRYLGQRADHECLIASLTTTLSCEQRNPIWMYVDRFVSRLSVTFYSFTVFFSITFESYRQDCLRRKLYFITVISKSTLVCSWCTFILN